MRAAGNPNPSGETLTVEILPAGKDEMNLAEFPITVLADRPPKGVKTLIFKHGKGKLIVTGSDAFGLPTALDDDVILSLIQLTKHRNNFTEPTVNFTRYELIRMLGWANEGKSYRRLDESLKRWTGVTLIYEKCWWDNRAKRNVDANIHIIDDVVIFDGSKATAERDTQEPLPLSTFTWNSRFMESFQADNLKDLDLDTYFSLKWMPSKRLYRFLDKRFYKRSDITFPIEEIAFTRVGLSQSYARNVAKIKEKLQPAITELEEIGFLEPLSRDQRYFKEPDGWKIRVVRCKTPAALEQPSAPLLAPPEPLPLCIELTNRGVHKATAADLVQRHPAEAIAAKIEVFDWLAAKKDRRVDKNPAGYLVKSIEADYVTPKGFIPQAEQQRQQAERQAKARQQAEAHRLQREQEARDRAELKAIDDYYESLSAEEKQQLDAEAEAQADPADLAAEFGPLKRMGQMIRRREHIRQLLKSREQVEA